MEPLVGLGRIDRTIDVVGVATAIVLLGLARWLLPKDDRPRIRLPVVYLLLAALLGALAFLTESDASIARIFSFLYTFFLLASCGRSLVLLAVDVVFGRR